MAETAEITETAAQGRTIRAVIFDMDGVLTDTEAVYQELLRQYFESRGVRLPQSVISGTIGASGPLNWRTLRDYATFASDYDEYIAGYRAFTEPRKHLFDDRLNPGARETLAGLREAGYRLALASSTHEARIRQALENYGLMDFFEAVVSGEHFKESKPHPEIYLTTAAMIGTEPAACLAVEDSSYGIASARDAGMTVVAKRDPRYPIDQSRAHYHIDDLIEVTEILQKINAKTTEAVG